MGLGFLNFKDKEKKSITIKINSKNPFSLPPLPDNSFLLVKGSGDGHGVGMSQWGAKDLAERGNTFRFILSHFYKGIRIKKRNIGSFLLANIYPCFIMKENRFSCAWGQYIFII